MDECKSKEGHHGSEEMPAPAKKARRETGRPGEGSSGRLSRLCDDDRSLLASLAERLGKLEEGMAARSREKETPEDGMWKKGGSKKRGGEGK